MDVRCALVALMFFIAMPAFPQVAPFVGAIGGVSTLSADGGSQRSPGGLSLSSYAPENGGALDVFAGVDLRNYFSVQGNFIWNRNNLHLNSASSANGVFYQENRTSSQKAAVLDFLLYFRKRNSRFRPYLGTGIGMVHFTSTLQQVVAESGSPALPPQQFSATGPVFRSHVGIDIRIHRKFSFRYSFSELIGRNPISQQLLPPGPRGLANFQNLFGFVQRF